MGVLVRSELPMSDLESELARFEAEIRATATLPLPPVARPPQV